MGWQDLAHIALLSTLSHIGLIKLSRARKEFGVHARSKSRITKWDSAAMMNAIPAP